MAENCPSSLISLNMVRTKSRWALHTFGCHVPSFNNSDMLLSSLLIWLFLMTNSSISRIENSTNSERRSSATSVAGRRQSHERHDHFCDARLYNHRVNHRFGWRGSIHCGSCWSSSPTGRRLFHIWRDSRSRRNGLSEEIFKIMLHERSMKKNP